jgi:general secretion pathway protein D
MIFLRPMVLKDERATATLTQDRYDYMRSLQNSAHVPAMPLLPDPDATMLPPLPSSTGTPLGR